MNAKKLAEVLKQWNANQELIEYVEEQSQDEALESLIVRMDEWAYWNLEGAMCSQMMSWACAEWARLEHHIFITCAPMYVPWELHFPAYQKSIASNFAQFFAELAGEDPAAR